MGYFSNGSEGEAFQSRLCVKCVHHNNDPDDDACPVWMAHLMFNYDQHNNEAVGHILDVLMPRNGIRNDCAMFISRAE